MFGVTTASEGRATTHVCMDLHENGDTRVNKHAHWEDQALKVNDLSPARLAQLPQP